MTRSAQDPNALYAPELPQMTDGRISIADLNQEQGVLIKIIESQNASQGDYLTLFWNGIQAGLLYIPTDTPADFFPWNITISTDLVPDGSYPVYYTRMDAASNIAVSPTVTALVRRSDTGILPAPSFPEAHNNTITGNDLADGSTLVQIPVYTGMTAGDDVFLYWVGYATTGEVVQSSVYSLAHSVSAGEAGVPFTLPVPAPYVSAIDTGYANAWYAVQPARGGMAESSDIGMAESSDIGMVEINTSQSILPAPSFTEGNDGWIDASEAADGTPVAIPVYPGITVNDVVTVNWQGLRENSPMLETIWSIVHTVQASEMTTGFSVTVPAVYILPVELGTGQAWYSVEFTTDGEGISATAVVNIDTQHTQLLPAPVLPEAAGDNTIDSTEYADGTPVQVTYPDMAAGDNVTLFWQGYQSDGTTPVADTAWSTVHTVTTAEVSAHTLTEIIPASVITPIGNGYATASYNVIFAGGVGINHSPSTQVKIMAQNDASLDMNCTTGAPIFDPTVLIRPLNTVFLTGPAGADVELSLPGGSETWFNPAGVQTLTLRLDDLGTASAQVYSFTPGNVLVSAYIITDPTLSTSRSMTFTNWLTGRGDLQYFGTSTGALANSICLCSVYLQTSALSTSSQARLALTLPTGAVIPASGTTTAFVNVSNSHAGGFDVSDTVAESVAFTLSLPDTGDYVQGNLVFSDQ